MRSRIHYYLVFGLFIITLLMSACDTSNSDDLPTVAVLPSSTDIGENEETPIADDATLPAKWTPTATETATLSPTATHTLTITPSATITDTASPTFTPSASPTQIPRPIVDLIQLAYSATILPDDYEVPFREGIEVTLASDAGQEVVATPNANTGVVIVSTADNQQYDTSVNCPFYPVGGFATAYTTDPLTAQLLGCPSGNPPDTVQVQTAYQVFERGGMLWIAGSPNQIYALFSDGTYQRFADSFDENVDPESGGETPPSGLQEPTRGFGKVWRTFANVKGNLGWALTIEIADSATSQAFTRGMMLFVPARGDILALMADSGGNTGTWKSIAGSF